MGTIIALAIMLLTFESDMVKSVFAGSLSDAFECNGVVPDVVPKAPVAALQVKYPSGATLSQGNELTPTQVKDQPEVTWDARPDAFYTLCITDPDAPCREKPMYGQALYWLVGNIRGGDVASGETLTAFVGSAPPLDTGFHRYVLLVYEQPGKIDFDEPRVPNTSADRIMFSITKFASKYKLGDPQFGNFYLAKYDDYVPVVFKQIGYA